MKYLLLIFQTAVLLIAMEYTVLAIHEFQAGQINEGLASMAVVIGTGVFQIVTMCTLIFRRCQS